jgi:DNA-binding transcriptional LysR family regulator
MLDSPERLPSLDLIRSFEAAARHLSFTKAAAELYVTQSAVSRSVKTLEDHLGVVLFHRRHRTLALSEPGQLLYRTATEVMERLRDASRRIRQVKAGHMVTVTSTISFAAMWLVPRLPEFREAHPDVEVRIAAANEMSDLEREGIDVAVRYCTPKTVAKGALKLLGEHVFPVCSPKLLGRGAAHPLRRPEDLRHQIMLHLEEAHGLAPWLHWNVWLEAMKQKDIVPAGVLRFSHYDQMIQAAIDGQGVALGRSPLVRRLIKQGKLAAPFESKSISSRAYFVLAAAGAAARPEVQHFIGWLAQTAKRESE